jgi:hypothetical protein
LLQHDPVEDFIVVAGDSDQITYMQIMANPETAFDHWMRAQIEVTFGFDLGTAPDPTNESLGVSRR